MVSKSDMMKKIQTQIMDHNSSHIFSLSQKDKSKQLYTLHIYNELGDYFKITKNNEAFCKQFTKMLFDTDKTRKQGCFNHQYSDDSSLYNESVESLANRYLQAEYTFILINENCEPLSVFCINNYYIWNICTNYNTRNKGHMKHLLNHVLKLIEYNKLNISFSELRLTVKQINPIRDMLLKFYRSFGFKIESNTKEQITMKLVINTKLR